MSSLISPIGSYLPTAVQIVRATAPIAVDYIVTRFLKAPRAAMIPALGTLVLMNRHVTTLEKVADSLLYFAYKALHRFFSRAENKTPITGLLHYEEIPPATTNSLSLASDFENLQTKFKEFISSMTWIVESSFDKVDPSGIREQWRSQDIIAHATKIFELAAKDSQELMNDLLMVTIDLKTTEQKYIKMAELLMDKNLPYHGRLCDPSKPSILFLYHLARGYGHYTRVGGTYYPHSLSLEDFDTKPFYQRDTDQSKWRSIYNDASDLWAGVLKHLPVDVRKWADKDVLEAPLNSVVFPDDFLTG